MSGSDRGRFDQIVAAFVIIAGVSLYWWMFYSMGASSARNDERAQKYAAHYAADTAKRIDQECVRLDRRALAECAVKIAEANRESERGESDLAAQWQAANWVLWASVIAGAQLIATLFGFYMLSELWMRRWRRWKTPAALPLP